MAHSHRARTHYLQAAIFVALGLAPSAWGQQTFWRHDPRTPGDWFDPANWSQGVPSAQTDAVISNNGTALIPGGSSTARTLRLGSTTWGETIGGFVRQTGGTTTTSVLNVQDGARYELAGGSLYVGQGMSLIGTLDFANSNATLEIGPQAIVHWTPGTVINAGQATVSVGPESLLIVPSGFDPVSVFGSFKNKGLVHELGTTLRIDADRAVRGVGAISGPVEVRGTLAAIPGGKIDLSGPLTVAGGLVDLGTGRFWNSSSASGSISAGKLIAKDELHEQSAHFVQSGGEHTAQSLKVSGNATYELTGGQLITETAAVANFIHTGGNYIAYGKLTVGNAYEMSGQAQLRAGQLSVVGPFRQSGGTSTVGILSLTSGTSDRTCVYELSGGQLTVLTEYFGSYGYTWSPTQFRQTGGVHSVGTLKLGTARANTHTYEMSGGQLHADTLEISYRYPGMGVVAQAGGSMAVDRLRIGKNGRFEFKGGSLSLGNDINVAGAFDLGGQEVNLTFGPASILDFGYGQLLNTQSASLHLGNNSLLVIPPGFDPASAFRSFSNAGITHVGGSPLVLAPNQGFTGSGILSDPTEVAGGAIIVPAKGRLEFAGGLSILPGGTITALGKLVIGQASTQTGGSIQADHFALAWDYTQRGGIVSAAVLSTNDESGNGTYNLVDGELRTGNALIADQYLGHFVQEGGIHRSSGIMTVLGDNDAKGMGYLLKAGRLEAKNLVIGGEWEGGRFTQAGGTSIAETLLIGPGSQYSIGAGTLEAADMIIQGTLSLSNTADFRITRRLTFEGGSRLRAPVGGTIRLMGADFQIQQTSANVANDTKTLNLIFEANTDRWSMLEVASQLRDSVADPYRGNFALGTLTIGGETPGRVRLVDLFDNQPGPEALYVDHLVMTAGSILDLNGIPLRYRTATLAPDAVILVPEPATPLLVLAALLGLGRRKRLFTGRISAS